MTDNVDFPHRSAALQLELSEVVDQLRLSREVTHNIRRDRRLRQLPSRKILAEIVEDIAIALFPGHLSPVSISPHELDVFVHARLSYGLLRLIEQVRRTLRFLHDDRDADQAAAMTIVQNFAERLPGIRNRLTVELAEELRQAPEFACITELFLCRPDVMARINRELATSLDQLGLPLLARMILSLVPAGEIGGR
jgi:serine O-acetyltransferase